MEVAEQQSVQQVYDYAAELMAKGQSDSIIQGQLLGIGLDQESATIVTDNLRSQFQEAHLAQAKKNMLHGGLWFGGGSLITGVTYAMASAEGGSYFMTWGAIIFGGFQFLQGAYQYLKHR
jgi:hypothetical protein